MHAILAALLALCLLAPPAARAQTPAAPELTAPAQRDLIEALGAALRNHYVFPERSDAILATLRAQLSDPAWRGADPKTLARLTTEALVAASGDMHFAVGFDPEWVALARTRKPGEAPVDIADAAAERAGNYGFRDAAILAGNIGYLRFDHFPDTQPAEPTIAAAMRFVSHVDALIIDLRYNNGGALETAQMIASYLFSGARDQMLFDYFYNRDGTRVARSQWVLPAVPGDRMADVPVVVLTGTTSFSAAEWLAFVLKKLGRATLIGGRTAGGAHPVDRVPVDDRFFLQVPIGRISDPVDGTDFEGTGVAPDIEVPSWRALDVARATLLPKLAAAHPDGEAAWALAAAAPLPPAAAQTAIARAVGRYEGRTLTLEDGALIYRWRDRFALRLEPIGETLFAVEGTSDYRFRLVLERGKVTAIERVLRDGEVIRYRRLP